MLFYLGSRRLSSKKSFAFIIRAVYIGLHSRGANVSEIKSSLSESSFRRRRRVRLHDEGIYVSHLILLGTNYGIVFYQD